MTLLRFGICPICSNDDKDYFNFVESVGPVDRVHCRVCGLTFFSSSCNDKSVYTFDYNMAYFRPSDIRKAGLMAENVANIIRGIDPKMKFLEVGPGNGLTSYLLSVMGFNVECLEIDKDTSYYITDNYNVPCYHADILKFEGINKWDFIYAAQLLEHFPFPLLFLNKCYNLLNPNGYLFIDTPDGAYGLEKGSKWHHFRTRNPYEHQAIFTTTTFQRACYQTKFIPERIMQLPLFESFQALCKKKSNE